jgi:tetratricopeptide (TPR) repeat protein
MQLVNKLSFTRYSKLSQCLLAAGLLAGSTMTMADNTSIQVLSAVVKDQHIAGATVIMQNNGAQSTSAVTDSNGMVNINTTFPDTSDSLVIIKKPGYSNLVAKCPCKGMSYAVSPYMTSLDGLRIVLNWGQYPADLDSHIAFANEHIYFEHKEGSASADANLDVDDTDSFGPETVTIEKKHAGEAYVYAVHDFTNLTNPNSSALTNSGAKVLVYIGQSLVRSYYVPKNAKGNLWTVFRITGEGEFQDINTMQGVQDDASNVLGSVNTYLNSNTQVAAHSVSAAAAASAAALNNAGEAAYHNGDLAGAAEYYRQAIDIDSNYGQAYSNLGLAYQKLNRTSEAIWANRKAIALAHGNNAATVRASSYYNIAKIYESAGQYQDALTQYQAAKRQKANPVYDKAIAHVRGLMR